MDVHRFKVNDLQEKERCHACILLWGLDDQDPNDRYRDYGECKTAGDPNIPLATVTAYVPVTAMMEETCCYVL